MARERPPPPLLPAAGLWLRRGISDGEMAGKTTS